MVTAEVDVQVKLTLDPTLVDGALSPRDDCLLASGISPSATSSHRDTCHPNCRFCPGCVGITSVFIGLFYQALRIHSMLAYARTYMALPFFACEEADIGAKSLFSGVNSDCVTIESAGLLVWKLKRKSNTDKRAMCGEHVRAFSTLCLRHCAIMRCVMKAREKHNAPDRQEGT